MMSATTAQVSPLAAESVAYNALNIFAIMGAISVESHLVLLVVPRPAPPLELLPVPLSAPPSARCWWLKMVLAIRNGRFVAHFLPLALRATSIAMFSNFFLIFLSLFVRDGIPFRRGL